MKKVKLFEQYLAEVTVSTISGTSGRTITSLDNRKYELKKDIKDARIGDYTNVILPKGTIITNLPGGVFAKHDDLKQKYCVGYKSERWSEDFGVGIRTMPDTLTAIEKDSKVLESLNEAKDVFPNEIIGNDQILFKKEWEKMNGGKLAAKYNQYYRGYDIDFGGHIFDSVESLEKFVKNYILSNNLYNKYKHMPEMPIKESLTEATTSWKKMMAGVKKSESGPWSLVAIENKKVVAQKNDIKIQDMLPAHFEAMRKEYPRAAIHIEDGTGMVVWNESLNEALIGDKLSKKFTDETGIATWDKVSLKSESGFWTVVRLWAPKDDGGMNPGLHIELTKGNSREHFQVMDDDGTLTKFGKEINKK